MNQAIRTAVALAALTASAPVLSHGGGLNADGCHTNRKTGDYHCHRAPSVAPTRAAPATPAAPTAPLMPSNTKAKAAEPRSSNEPTCYVGPRGGTYTITRSGKKNYSGC